ncbi:DNA replication and repair protein RecF [Ferrimonas balearica DSM 9799]|uniref:DNA replication and repair protein RecF n=1 Tax=Ferrimonas balearica (strain DSM 9799 / CCM 4581 / KCTC 23876 / PAT) TaxID=550540 RepID=E1SUL2_FERBD|nr:DNA replication/repair protein RecF [Ferrimonas balearica]MBY6019919.1 DNA replication/repair protein RecF [Halomonas denitrificans]ADN74217.1 DNA replication and repair protein RecF [Ferrimonas balearica DSM 9799]MBW3141702.1 DNA replication/repair protein RecF [Ferrimonas balearica]MBW3166690.1 DNA replication/repair protein RecF [Ferrimonas balearica]MBY5982434.1 DNA replication/repair protein RecF [Ferrimonas balearica]
MGIDRLHIQNLRNIQAATLEPAGGLNLIYGDNGSGKTSVLEAIWFLSVGRSFRTHLAPRAIRHDEPNLVLFARTTAGEKLGLRRGRDGDNEVRINGERPERLADLAACLPLQLISPESFALLLEGPQARREFIDWGAFHSDPQFIGIWSRYRRLLKQRNQLLRQQAPDHQFAIWDKQLSEYGEALTAIRKRWVSSLNDTLTGIINQFLPDLPIRVSFSQGWDSKSPLSAQIQGQLERDKQLGYTVSGPHKADLRLRVGNLPVQDGLSRGQLKLLVCALKIAQGKILGQKDTSRGCIYLVDDLASELDESHRTLLLEQLISTGEQVFVTAIEPGQLAMIPWDKRFHVEQGRVTEQN